MSETTNEVGNTLNEGGEVSAPEVNTNTALDSGTGTENNTVADTEQGAGSDAQTQEFSWDSYEVPEGVTVTDDQKAFLSDWSGKIKNEGNLLDFVLELASKGQEELKASKEAEDKKQKEELDSMYKSWENELKADPEFGKEYAQNMKRSADTIVKFGGSEFAKVVKDYGLTNQPVFNKFLNNISKQFEDAKLITSTNKSVSQSGTSRDKYGNPSLSFTNSFGEK